MWVNSIISHSKEKERGVSILCFKVEVVPLSLCCLKTGISLSYIVSYNKSSKHYYANHNIFFSHSKLAKPQSHTLCENQDWMFFSEGECMCMRCARAGAGKHMNRIWFTVFFRDRWSVIRLSNVFRMYKCWRFYEKGIYSLFIWLRFI